MAEFILGFLLLAKSQASDVTAARLSTRLPLTPLPSFKLGIPSRHSHLRRNTAFEHTGSSVQLRAETINIGPRTPPKLPTRPSRTAIAYVAGIGAYRQNNVCHPPACTDRFPTCSNELPVPALAEALVEVYDCVLSLSPTLRLSLLFSFFLPCHLSCGYTLLRKNPTQQ
jgi:hypothetical protein